MAPGGNACETFLAHASTSAFLTNSDRCPSPPVLQIPHRLVFLHFRRLRFNHEKKTMPAKLTMLLGKQLILGFLHDAVAPGCEKMVSNNYYINMTSSFLV